MLLSHSDPEVHTSPTSLISPESISIPGYQDYGTERNSISETVNDQISNMRKLTFTNPRIIDIWLLWISKKGVMKLNCQEGKEKMIKPISTVS